MCKHCERLKEDINSKDLIHAFFKDLAEKCNRHAKEDRQELVRPITPNDIEITVNINCVVWKTSYVPSDIRCKVLKMLTDFQS